MEAPNPQAQPQPEDMQPSEKAVPKFASFRPKAPLSSRNLENVEEKGSKSRSRSRRRFRDKPPTVSSHRGHRSSAHRSSKDQESYVRENRGDHDSHESPDRSAILHEDYPKQFVVDRSGDPKNLTFGTLDRYAIPRYSRIGAGSVIGTLNRYKIDRDSSTEKGLVLSHRGHDVFNSQEKSVLRRLARQETKELRIRPLELEHQSFDPTADFILVGGNRPRKRRRGNDGSGIDSSSSEDDAGHYRSIEGKAKEMDQPADPDLQFGDEQDNPSSPADSVLQRRVALSQRVDESPGDVEAWLELINHQDRVLSLGKEGFKGGLTNAERMSNADIKISMYEKALGHVKDLKGQEALVVGMMHEASTIVEDEKLASKWKLVLQQYPEHLRLWTDYLDFRQTDFSSFKYEATLEIYLDCQKILHQARTERATDEQLVLYEIQIYVLLRSTLLMRESGFTELAVATWQALLEFEFFRPSPVQSQDRKAWGPNRDDLIASFEEFWDSEVARVGEEGAQGWAKYCQKGGDPPEPRAEVVEERLDTRNLFSSWAVCERKRATLSRQPARTIDHVEEDDPYRVILFSDVKPLLVESPTSASPEILLQGFLAFCHLPPCQTVVSANATQEWFRDGFVRNEKLYSTSGPAREKGPRTLQDASQDGGLSPPSNNRGTPFNFLTPEYQLAPDTLFAKSGSWFSAFDAWQDEYHSDDGPLASGWVLRTLRALATMGAGGDELAEYCLALELRVSPNTVKKTAKSLLKNRPSSLRLYNAYALLEYRLDNASKGENVLITSINMSKQFKEDAQRDAMFLWRTWLWELLSAGKTKEAFRRLLSFADEVILPQIDSTEQNEMNPALMLRTERALTATRDQNLSLHFDNHAAVAAECLILFTYLRDSLSLSSAASSFETNLAILTASPSPTPQSHEEHLHQSFAHLLHHHATHTRLVKPSQTRSFLATSIAAFPQNTLLLSLYAWNETRFRIDDRVRSIVRDVVLNHSHSDTNNPPRRKEGITSHFFAIHTELHRGLTFGSNAHAIRAAFERAVDSACGKHCAGLWKMFFLFELRDVGEVKRAREVFWRGMRACPWAKELYLIGVEELGVGFDDLRGVYGLLGERELRVHVDLEEGLEEIDGEG